MAATFVIELPSSLPPGETLRRVLDLRAHTRVIPLTRVTPEVAAADLAVGTVLVARTSIGPFGFDDPMRLDELSFQPAAATITKLGKTITGVVRITVEPTATGSVLRWEQSVDLPWLPRLLLPPAVPILSGGYRRVLRRLIAEPDRTR